MIDLARFCFDSRIDADNSRKGWIHLNCPFCEDRGYHLGYNLGKGYFFCLRCGWHPDIQTIQALTKFDEKKTRKILLDYKVGTAPGKILSVDKHERPDELKWPEGCGPLAESHKKYLRKRDFDPDRLEREWGLMGTGIWGSHSFRIVAPIVFREEAVSWQTRDITDKEGAKYLPCPKEKEILPHKHLLYGFDKARWKTAVVVEGITGVWRLGPGAVATFGVMFTNSQLLLLARMFDRILIFYDDDEAGLASSDKMGVELMRMGKDVEIINTGDQRYDSGNIPDDVAEEIMKEVKK